MKKLIYLISILAGLVMTSCSIDEIEDINNRLDQLEKTQIASLSEQIANIKVSLAKLEGVDNSLDVAIKGLESLVGVLKTQLESNTSANPAAIQELQKKIQNAETLIAQLSAADIALENKVIELKSYVNSQLATNKNWAESTFATLTQYYELESTLLGLSALIEQVEENITTEYTAALTEAIEASETSMKVWVNKCLAENYYDMADIDAKLDLLQDRIKEGDTDLAQQITNQKAALDQAVKDFNTTVQSAIAAAVEGGGAINVEIAGQIEAAMDKVDIKLAVIENMIAAINLDIAAIRDDIASIQEQMDSINTTIADLQIVDTELNDYLATLTEQYESLSAAYDKLAELVKNGTGSGTGSGAGPGSTPGSGSNADLEEYKAAIEAQLAAVEQSIQTLQSGRKELQGQIEALQIYVDDKLAYNQEWATATFTTLSKFNQLSDVVATIKAQIETLSEMNVRLETLATKDELSNAISSMSSSLQADIQAAVENCSTAMLTMQQELTSAYQSAISAAIFNSEQTMKSWVNNKLANYYTAAQIDAKIEALKSNLEGQLSSQKIYLESIIDELELSLDTKIENNALLITELISELESTNSQIATLASSVTTNTQKIAANAQAISVNASSISDNASKISTNTQAIAAANKLISDNKKLIEENESLIEANADAIETLQDRITASGSATENGNAIAIAANTRAISENAEDIAANADLIAVNADAIVNNSTAISQNAADIQQAKADIEKAKIEITEAYQKAIQDAIGASGGQLNGNDLEALNSRITSEIAAINETLANLSTRVAACEKDIKSIKTSIYNMQIEISDIQDQIEAILARIQSIEYIPQYADGKATMYYTNNGRITPGSATFDFELQPAATAEELAGVWEDALSMKAVHTQTRAAVDFVDMEIVSVTAEDGVLTVVASGADLSDDFYLGRISANACLVVSDGNNQLASDYINMVPWTTDIIYVPDAAFKAYLVKNFDTDSDG